MDYYEKPEEQEKGVNETGEDFPKEEKVDSVGSPEEKTDPPQEESKGTTDTGTVFSRTSFEEEKNGGSKSKMIIMICLIIIFTILGFVGGYFYAKDPSSSSAPLPVITDTVPTSTPTPVEEGVDLSAYSIEILNGSGVAGVAGSEQEALEADEFNVENTGNAENQDFTETIIAVKSDVSEEFIEKLRDSLEERYVVAAGTEELEDDNDYDVVVTIGSETVEDE